MWHDRQKTGTVMDDGVRVSDAHRDSAAAQLQLHFAAGRMLAGLAFAAVNRPLPARATMVMTVVYVPGGGGSYYRINLPPSSMPEAERQKLIQQRGSELERAETRIEAAIAGSRPVMAAAARAVRPAMSVQELRSEVRIDAVTDIWMWISARGASAAQADHLATAVADSYVAYVSGKNAPGGRVLLTRLACRSMTRRPRVMPCWMRAVADPPVLVLGPSLLALVLDAGGLGALCGALIGAFAAVARSRPSRRFRVT
jgi:hypothetical protein